MIEIVQGNLLRAEAEALVNTVNCVGVMGKGIALQFKQAWPEMAKVYERACAAGEIQPGMVQVWPTGELLFPKYVINFPTKRNWIHRSRYQDIESGLMALVETIKRLGIESIALPPLGCGNGGLAWSKVRPMIETAFASVPEVRVLLFAPEGEPNAFDRVIGTSPPKLTRARALLLASIDRYAALAFDITLLEIQKLGYFLQAAGEPMRLNVQRAVYGPYADNLNKVLEVLNGHFLFGFDGNRAPQKEITLSANAARDALKYLESDMEALERLGRVGKLIEGFETPYGMELLSTVHYLATVNTPRVQNVGEAIEETHKWNSRKRELFSAEHIRIAWDHLVELGWIDSAKALRV
jgi:O-acetyl-ADP-ribose deacetylase (regulator of RNase III)/uncharacterized protein YwgA